MQDNEIAKIDEVNPQNLPTVISDHEALRILQEIEEKKIEVLAAEGKGAQYVKKNVEKYHPLWWHTIIKDMTSDDPMIRRSAQIEFNKLQCRVLPTELTSPEDGGLIVKLATYDNNNQ